MAYIHANDLRCALLKQAVGKAARALAHVQATPTGHRQPRGLERALQLQPTAREVPGFGAVEQFDLGDARNVITVFCHLLPRQSLRESPLHTGCNEPLCLGPGGGMAALHQKHVCAHRAILWSQIVL
ncbi:hypothetical protein D3C71_1512710 [compost metagenome]